MHCFPLVADILGTQSKEDARPVFAQGSGVIRLKMVGTHEIGCIAREMIAGIGLHRIHLQYILLRRSPEDIQLGTLVRIMVDGSAAVVARISPWG